MSADADVEQMQAVAMTLSAPDRARLAEALIASLDDTTEEPLDGAELDRAWQAEAARRAAECQAGAVVARPASAVFAAARERLRKP